MLLQTHHLTKHYGSETILSNISLQIQARERVGLVGVNGAGKSTLLKILAGTLSYDSGEIFKAKETTIGYLEQNSGLRSNLDIWHELVQVFAEEKKMERELRQLEQQMSDPLLLQDPDQYGNVLQLYDELQEAFKKRNGYEIDARIRSVLHGMGFASTPYDTPIAHLSGGQRTRLALAKLLLTEPDILMLDEPTNHLDLATLNWLESYLSGYNGAILVVSHDRYFLNKVVSVIYEIERSEATRYTGNYTDFVEQKAAELERKLKEYEKQQSEISKMEDFVQRNIARASTSNRAKSRKKALQRMDRMDEPLGDVKKAAFRFEIERPTGKAVLKAENLWYEYENGHKPFQQPLQLELQKGESVALIGPNGSGKSTLLKLLVGELIPVQGNIVWGANVKIAYYDQEHSQLTPGNTVLEEVWSSFPQHEEVHIRTVLGHFLFSGDDVAKKISSLSGGEKARVLLAKLMLLKANVLILDEPTNHLDLYSKEVLESALLDYEGTILFISHDRYFLNKLSEKIVEMSVNGLTYYLGNFDDYVNKKDELEEIRKEQQTAAAAAIEQKDSPANLDHTQQKQAKQEERNRQRKTQQLEDEISRLETEIAALEAEMALPEVSQNYERLQELMSRSEQMKQQLEQFYADWESLM